MKLSLSLRRVAVTVALATTALAGAPTIAANAGPYPGEGQSVRTTYYSDATRTIVVGETAYGDCGEDYAWGTTSSYRTYTVITCQPN
jgi:hypothetical protein